MPSISMPQMPSTDALSLLKSSDSAPSARNLEVKEKFQEFVAGTFFRQMLKSLRDMEMGAAYFDGGRGEEVFRAQLDEQIADQLAKSEGQSIAEPMYRSFQSRMEKAGQFGGSRPDLRIGGGETAAAGRQIDVEV